MDWPMYVIQEHSVPTITSEGSCNFCPFIKKCVTAHRKLKFTNSYFKQMYICKHKRYKEIALMFLSPQNQLHTTSFLTKSKSSEDQMGRL